MHIFFLISETNRGGFGLDMNCGRLLAIPSLFRASCVVFLALAFTTSFGSSYRYIYYPSKYYYISFKILHCLIPLGSQVGIKFSSDAVVVCVIYHSLPPTILNFGLAQLAWWSKPAQNSKLLPDQKLSSGYWRDDDEKYKFQMKIFSQHIINK